MLSYKSMNKENKDTPDLITLKEACDILRCHPNTLRQWDRKGILVAFRFGERKDRRYNRKDVLNFIKSKSLLE